MPKFGKKSSGDSPTYTAIEPVIQDGEFVNNPTPNGYQTSAPPPALEYKAPTVVNGVTTYSTWDDVDARSVSAADKIISKMR